MGVGEHDRVDRRRIDRELVPVAQAQFLQALEEAAIDQDPRASVFDQEAAAGDGAGRAEKAQGRRGGGGAWRSALIARSRAPRNQRRALNPVGRMFDGIAGDHRSRAGAPDEIERAGREDRMHHGRIDRPHTALAQGVHGRGDGRAAARDVVITTARATRGISAEAHAHSAIAQRRFTPTTHRTPAARATALIHGSDSSSGPTAIASSPPCRSSHRAIAGAALSERPRPAVTSPRRRMRWRCASTVSTRSKARPRQLAEDRLRDWLAGAKDPVLAHVGEVGRDQRDAPRAGAAQRVGRQQRRHQLAVGIVERLHHDGVGAGAMGDPDQRFAVGKGMRAHGRERRAEVARQPPRKACRIGNSVDDRKGIARAGQRTHLRRFSWPLDRTRAQAYAFLAKHA